MKEIIPIIIFVINIGLLPLFAYLLKLQKIWVSALLLFLSIIGGILVSIITLITFGGAFGPGALLCFSPVITNLITFIIWIVLWRKLFPTFETTRRILYILGGILFLLVNFAPTLGILFLGSECDIRTEEYADGIIGAIEQYYIENQEFPEDLSEIIPGYFNGDLSFNCLQVIGINSKSTTNHFELGVCNDHPSLITTSTDSVHTIWYDLVDKEWSYSSWLDFPCE